MESVKRSKSTQLSEAGYKICCRGHEKTPENTSKNRACKICAKERTMARRKANYTYKVKIKKKFCINGHERSPENVYASGACKICTKNKNKEKLKKRREKYHKNPEVRAKCSAAAKKWRSEKGKEWCKEYKKKPQVKAKDAERKKSSKYKEYMRAYDKKIVDELRTSYVVGRLHIPTKLATEELIEIKRLTIQLKRSLKNDGKI